MAHWHSPINAFRSPHIVERTEGSFYRLLLSFKNISGHNSKAKHTTVYPIIPSTLRPVEHDDSLPIPKLPQKLTLHPQEPTSNSPKHEPGPLCSNVDPDFPELSVPHLI